MIEDKEVKAPFMGVEKSFSGNLWHQRFVDQSSVNKLSQMLDVPSVVGQILAGRGVKPFEAARYLNPTLRELLPDPSIFCDMDLAVGRIVAAVRAGEKIIVFGDYDVDGATSVALLIKFLRFVGAVVDLYIPDRIAEGYGPNIEALKQLAVEGARVVITVDCGTTAHEALQHGKAAGLDIIVVDHHLPETQLPAAYAVINPNRSEESGEFSQLAAVGMTFLLVVSLNRTLKKNGWYARASSLEPDLLQYLDLVALGTVCDVVPLSGLNRALVLQGLKVIKRRRNAGLVALSDVSGISQPIGTYHLGFILGPRVNAGGRIGRADLGARLLSEDNSITAHELAHELDQYNAERKAVEVMVYDEARSQVKELNLDRSVIVVAKTGWHPGVLGIVASRLVEQYKVPVFVISLNNGIGKGSGRSVRGVDIGTVIVAAREAGLLINGGGHTMAAGLTIEEENLVSFKHFLSNYLNSTLDTSSRRAILSFDGALTVSAATAEFIDLLGLAGPYGQGNSEPRFVIVGTRIIKVDIVGSNHVRCILSGAGGGRLKSIAFRAANEPLGKGLLDSVGKLIHVGGYLRVDEWQGRRIPQLIIQDAAPSD